MLDQTVIGGKQIPFTRERVNVSDLELDVRNPRIQYVVGQLGKKEIADKDLDAILWKKDQVKALAAAIKQNGGVNDPIIVQRKGKKYIVREGNSRTVSCRHLMEQHPGDARFMTVPAMVFDVDLTEQDVAVMLADLHVAGKIRWDAYEQAKHITELYDTWGKTYDWLSTHLRLGKSKINQDMDAYKATTEYLNAHPDPANLQKFAFFQELMKNKPLRLKFEKDKEFKQTFHRWLTEERLTASREVRHLDKIVADQAAVKALDQKGYEAAEDVLRRQDPSLESELFHAVKVATEELKRAPASDIHDLKGGTSPQKLIMLRNLHRAVEDLATLAEVKL